MHRSADNFPSLSHNCAEFQRYCAIGSSVGFIIVWRNFEPFPMILQMALDALILNIGDLPTRFLFTQSEALEELARHYRNFLIESPRSEAVKKSDPRPLGRGPSDRA